MVDSNPKAIREALVGGPVNVLIDAGSFYFQGYRSGILDSLDCGDKINHSVVAVGFGQDNDGIEYFILKNSWGESWGDKGFIKIKATEGKGVCGMNT